MASGKKKLDSLNDRNFRVRGGGAGLVVNNLALLHQIENTDETGQPVLLQVDLHRDLHGVGFDLSGKVAFAQVGVEQTPACRFVGFLLPGFPFTDPSVWSA